MEPDQIVAEGTEVLLRIAQKYDYIKSVHLFGSRIRGNYSASSDLDAAIEVQWIKGMGVISSTFDLWVQVKPEILREIQSLTTKVKFDLQCYVDESQTPIVHAGLSDASLRIYP